LVEKELKAIEVVESRGIVLPETILEKVARRTMMVVVVKDFIFLED
jgi:hypothetical protein